MTLLGANGFDPSKHTPLGAAIPAGRYVAAIVGSEIKATKAKDGEYLLLRYQILEGDYMGRRLFVRLNLKNPNERTESLARAELSAICHAVGIKHLRDSEELHGLPMVVLVIVKRRDDNGETENVIRGYYPHKKAAPPPRQGRQTCTGDSSPWDD